MTLDRADPVRGIRVNFGKSKGPSKCSGAQSVSLSDTRVRAEDKSGAEPDDVVDTSVELVFSIDSIA